MSDFLYGWITPKGEFFRTAPYKHMQQIFQRWHKNDPEVTEALKGCEQERKDVAEIEQACQERHDSGDHPEWHYYESASSDLEYSVHRALVLAGFIRVGSTLDDICFEGTAGSLKKHRRRCKDLAIENHREARFESI